MGYSTGMMNKRVTVAKRYDEQNPTFGGSTSVTKYEILGTFWAAEDFNRGVKSLREGAYDAYDTVMFRMRYHEGVDRWCLLKYNGKWYQIQSFNESYQDNTIQITAIEMANQKVTIVEPTPEPASNAGATDETTSDAEGTDTTDETEPATEGTGTATPAVNPEPQNEG